MSGTMQQQAPPQLPPQVLAMLMQQAMQRGQMPPGAGAPPAAMQGPMGAPNVPNPGQGGAPPMMPPMSPPAAGNAQIGMAQPGMPMAPRMMPPGVPPGQMPGPGPGQMQAPNPFAAAQQQSPAAQMARQGRFGDSVVAHMEPGEIAIPPQIQTPELMAVIRQAFARAGVNPTMFTAGSQTTSRNPATGAQEFSLLTALLPIAGAIGGSFIPGVGTAAGAALGGGLGGAASGALSGMTPTQIAMMTAGGAAGGYLGGGGLGNLGSGAGGGGTIAEGAGAAPIASQIGGTGGASGLNLVNTSPGALTSAAGATNAAGSGLWDQITNLPWKAGFSAATGASLAGALTPGNSSSGLPPGFNNPLPALNPNFNTLRGANTSSTPSFTGYNPYAAVSGANPGYSFYQPLS